MQGELYSFLSRGYWIVHIFVICSFISCNSAKKDQISIACNLPLTGSLSTYGESVRDGITFALEHLAHDSNYQNTLHFDFQDNTSTARDAVNIAKRQFATQPDIYVSGVKPQTMAIIDDVVKADIPHYVWVFDAYITRNYPKTFRTWVNYKYEPEQYLKYIEAHQPKKIAIIYVQLPHAEEEMNDILIPQIRERGINDLFIEPFLFNRDDFKDIVLEIQDYQPDLIIINGFKSHIITLITQLRGSNLIDNGNVIVTYDMLDAAEDMSLEMLEGIHFITPNSELPQAQSQDLKNWKNEFKKRFGRTPRYTDVYAYEMVNIIYQASLSKPESSEKWERALQNVHTQSITGELQFDEQNDLKIPLKIARFINGNLEVFGEN